MNARKKMGLLLVIGLCLILIAWWWTKQTTHHTSPLNGKIKSPPNAKINSRQLGESHLKEWRAQGLKSSFRREDGVLVVVFPDVPEDQPMVEFHAFLPTDEGGLEPVKITGMQFMRKGPDGLDSGDFSSGEHLVGCSEVGDGYCTFVGGDDCKGRRFTLGQRYYVQFGVLDNGGEEAYFESFFAVPEDIPRGKVYHVNLVARTPANTYAKQKAFDQCLRGKISDIDTDPSKLQVTYVMPGDGQLIRRLVDSAGGFQVGSVPLGGCLLVEDQRSAKGDEGHVHFMSRNVAKRELLFPRDADLSVRTSDTISFKLSVPNNIAIEEVQGVGLKMRRDDSFPVAWNQLPRMTTKRELDLRFAPGDYFVEIVTKENGGEPEFAVLGQISVKAEDSGKAIRIQTKLD